MEIFYKTKLGQMYLGDALDFMSSVKDNTINLIVTSPPFGLVRKKDYGNVDADQYLEWFRPFAEEFPAYSYEQRIIRYRYWRFLDTWTTHSFPLPL